MRPATALALALASLAGCDTASVQITAECRVTDYGILEPVEPSRRSYAPGATAGSMAHLQEGEIVFAERTRRIPARHGLRFGFAYELVGLPAETPVTFVVSHPPMQEPGREVSEGYHHQVSGLHSYGYGFDADWELVEGIWHFQLLHDGRLLCEQGFETYLEEPSTDVDPENADEADGP